jgi:hypothetical protein
MEHSGSHTGFDRTWFGVAWHCHQQTGSATPSLTEYILTRATPTCCAGCGCRNRTPTLLVRSAALKQANRVVICGYSLPPADERGCDLILRNPNKRTKVEIVCGSQGLRITNDLRNAGYEDIAADPTGYFEDWVERRVQEQRRKENLKVDQVVRALDGGTPVMKLPQ